MWLSVLALVIASTALVAVGAVVVVLSWIVQVLAAADTPDRHDQEGTQ